ncbi:MAG: cation diffusion facilitator family transporter [Candidatus Nanoarchaeia archaeon]
MHEHVEHLKENRKILKFTLIVVFGYMFVELFVGFISGSLALLADAGHMFADSAALLIAFLASWVATRRAPPEKTFGYLKAETLAGFANCSILAILAFSILSHGIKKLAHAENVVIAWPVIFTALIGLIVNIFIVQKLHHGKEIYMKAAFYEVLFDTAGSISVLASAILIYFTKIYWFDAVCALILGILIIPRLLGLFKELINSILETVPEHIEFKNLVRDMLKVKGVKEVHDLHIWEVASGFVTLSAHIVAKDKKTIHTIENMLHKKYHIWHATLQYENKPLKEKLIHGRFK